MRPVRMIRFLPLLLAVLLAAPALAQEIRLDNVYGRATLHSAAVFLTITNLGSTADRLVSVTTPAAESAMLHVSEFTDGIASMRMLADGLILSPGTTELARGGTHIMLTGLSGKLEQGAIFPLVLAFERAGEIRIEVPVDNARAE